MINDVITRPRTPVKVVDVAAWAKEFAALMEPTSLGRPHFSKYLGTKGVNMDLVFGPRSGSGRGVLTADGQCKYSANQSKIYTPVHHLECA